MAKFLTAQDKYEEWKSQELQNTLEQFSASKNYLDSIAGGLNWISNPKYLPSGELADGDTYIDECSNMWTYREQDWVQIAAPEIITTPVNGGPTNPMIGEMHKFDDGVSYVYNGSNWIPLDEHYSTKNYELESPGALLTDYDLASVSVTTLANGSVTTALAELDNTIIECNGITADNITAMDNEIGSLREDMNIALDEIKKLNNLLSDTPEDLRKVDDIPEIPENESFKLWSTYTITAPDDKWYFEVKAIQSTPVESLNLTFEIKGVDVSEDSPEDDYDRAMGVLG